MLKQKQNEQIVPHMYICISYQSGKLRWKKQNKLNKTKTSKNKTKGKNVKCLLWPTDNKSKYVFPPLCKASLACHAKSKITKAANFEIDNVSRFDFAVCILSKKKKIMNKKLDVSFVTSSQTSWKDPLPSLNVSLELMTMI